MTTRIRIERTEVVTYAAHYTVEELAELTETPVEYLRAAAEHETLPRWAWDNIPGTPAQQVLQDEANVAIRVVEYTARVV